MEKNSAIAVLRTYVEGQARLGYATFEPGHDIGNVWNHILGWHQRITRMPGYEDYAAMRRDCSLLQS